MYVEIMYHNMTVNASGMTNFSFGTGIISWPYDEADVDGGNDDGGVEDGGDEA